MVVKPFMEFGWLSQIESFFRSDCKVARVKTTCHMRFDTLKDIKKRRYERSEYPDLKCVQKLLYSLKFILNRLLPETHTSLSFKE